MRNVSYSSDLGASQSGSLSQRILPTLWFTPEPVGFQGAERRRNMSDFFRHYIKVQWLTRFLVVFAVIVLLAWWGLDMGKAPVPRQSPAPDLGSDIHLSQNAPAPDVSPPVSEAAPAEPSATDAPAAVVQRDRISDLLAAGGARARPDVVKGKKRFKVEFLTTEGTVSEVYSANALSREGWKLSVFPNRQMAKLSNDKEAHDIPVVDSKKNNSSRSSRTAHRVKPKASPVGDHATVTYIKLP